MLLNVIVLLNKDDADQLLKFRENISKEIKKLLFEKAQSFNVNVEDVSFMNLGFSRESCRIYLFFYSFIFIHKIHT